MTPGRAPTRRAVPDKRALTTQMQACASLLEGLPHAAWLVEMSSRRVMAINDAAVTLLGRPREELEGALAEALAASPEDLAWWDEAAIAHASPLPDDFRPPHTGKSPLHPAVPAGCPLWSSPRFRGLLSKSKSVRPAP